MLQPHDGYFTRQSDPQTVVEQPDPVGMCHRVGPVILRRPDVRDIDALYNQKNDPEVANPMGGFTFGYSKRDIECWLEAHRTRRDEAIWVIVDPEPDACLGHVGLYNIDGRVRSAEYAIMIGDKRSWGKGLGTLLAQFALDYAFGWLNLNRVHVTALAVNERSIAMCERVGFQREGLMRQAQFKDGKYIDVVVMSKLRDD